MSTEAVAWALKVARTSVPIHKLVLLALANHAHKDGTGAYCSARTIAADTGLSLRSVQRYLVELENDGWLTRGDQSQAVHIDPRYRPVVYDLPMPQPRHGDVPGRGSGTSPAAGQLRQNHRSATSLLTYKPRTNQELNRRAPRELSTQGGQPPTLAALRAAERDLCEHEATRGRCALCRMATP